MDKLQKCPNLKCDFIERNQFWAGKPHDKDIVRDYEENLARCHFTMCNRGAGNFTMRFYQALSIGKIPILVDTDMVFPFENEIPWDEICVRSTNEDDLITKTIQFYHSRDIEQTQKLCYDMYHKFFDREYYFTRIIKEVAVKYSS